MTAEKVILKNLIKNDDYVRKVLPFIDEEYFSNSHERIMFSHVRDYFNQYNNTPSKEALGIIISNDKKINEKDFESIKETLTEINDDNEQTNTDFLIHTTEKFCKDKAIYNAIIKSVNIIEGKDQKLDTGVLPKLLSDALAVSFDNHIGHDYIDNYQERYEFYHRKENKVPFGLDYFNRITSGGVSEKTLTVILAGCVHPDTKVKIRFKKKMIWTEKEVNISEIKELLEDGYEVEVSSPDDWVKVNYFIDKGLWEEYILQTNDGRIIRCNQDHLFETQHGWLPANHLVNMQSVKFLNITGEYVDGKVEKTNNMIPIVDINVEHKNHRYYTNGISSHNTGVGKSLFMCDMASSTFMGGKNVLYITLEMSEERIAERIDSNLLNVPITEMRKLSIDNFSKKISAVKTRTGGKLVVKEYPTASANVNHFRTLLNELQIKKNFIPDIIFIDYLNICTSSRMKVGSNVNSYTYIKSIAEEIRGLAVEFSIPIVSATQTTRSGFCLSLDTKIIINDGEVIPIEDVKVGDKVLSNTEYNIVTYVFPKRKKKLYKVTTKSGKSILCSEEHIFPTKNGDRSLKTGMGVGDFLLIRD